MQSNFWDEITNDIESLKQKNLYRVLKPPPSGSSDFKSNDYLNLAKHPKVIKAAQDAVEKYGVGARASRLVCGNLPIHNELESAIAAFKKTQDALVFPSGFQTNLGLVSALCSKEDFIAIDHLSHASIIDAVKLSAAPFRTYPHLNYKQLIHLLKSEISVKARRRFIITDGVFSMDGDVADIPALLNIAEDFDAILIVDDAHGTGTLGKTGRGIFEHFDIIPNDRTILMGTLSKALGSQGGFIAGKSILKEYLINHSRSFIYSTGLNPSSTAAAFAAIEIIKNEPSRVVQLQENSRFFRSLLKDKFPVASEPPTPIIPIIIGSVEKTIKISKSLKLMGFDIIAIRPPTVKPNSSRLRISVSSEHKKEELINLAEALRKAAELFK